ncbi:MAG: glycosyltransferase family 4 protein [Blastocatellia bacterium]
MDFRVNFIERKSSDTVSIESVFRQIGKELRSLGIDNFFTKLPYGNGAFDVFKNLLRFRAVIADIYHVTGHIHYISLILPPERTVLTIHDLGILRMRSGLRRWVLKELLFDLPVKRLKYITVVSEATKRELIDLTGCPEEKITVIENPVRDHFIGTEKKEFNTDLPNVLQIGTAPNKNLINLIRALGPIKCRLTIIGEIYPESKKLLQESSLEYSNKSNLNDEQLREEYSKADVVAFCSKFEGFGLPIIEAQAMRRLVVTSNLSPMREVAGDGAVLVDPFDPESIRSGFARLISDEDHRNDLIEKGLQNVKRFDSKLITEYYSRLYLRLLANSKST